MDGVKMVFVPRDDSMRQIMEALNSNYLVSQRIFNDGNILSDPEARHLQFILLGQMFGSGKTRLMVEFLRRARELYSIKDFEIMKLLYKATYVSIDFRGVTLPREKSIVDVLYELICSELDITMEITKWIELNRTRLHHRGSQARFIHLGLYLRDSDRPILLHLDEIHFLLHKSFQGSSKGDLVANATSIWMAINILQRIPYISVVAVGRSAVFYALGRGLFSEYPSPGKMVVIHLPPFTTTDIISIVDNSPDLRNLSSFLFQHNITSKIADKIYRKSGGIPLLIHSLIVGLSKEIKIDADDDAYFNQLTKRSMESIKHVTEFQVNTFSEFEKEMFVKLLFIALHQVPVEARSTIPVSRDQLSYFDIPVREIDIEALAAILGFYTKEVKSGIINLVLPLYRVEMLQEGMELISPEIPLLPSLYARCSRVMSHGSVLESLVRSTIKSRINLCATSVTYGELFPCLKFTKLSRIVVQKIGEYHKYPVITRSDDSACDITDTLLEDYKEKKIPMRVFPHYVDQMPDNCLAFSKSTTCTGPDEFLKIVSINKDNGEPFTGYLIMQDKKTKTGLGYKKISEEVNKSIASFANRGNIVKLFVSLNIAQQLSKNPIGQKYQPVPDVITFCGERDIGGFSLIRNDIDVVVLGKLGLVEFLGEPNVNILENMKSPEYVPSLSAVSQLLSDKKRKHTTTDTDSASKKSKKDHNITILIRQYEKKKGSKFLKIEQGSSLQYILVLANQAFGECDGSRVALRTADDNETIIEQTSQLVSDKLYYALTKEQEESY